MFQDIPIVLIATFKLTNMSVPTTKNEKGRASCKEARVRPHEWGPQGLMTPEEFLTKPIF
jgi:hypothetical protein